MDNQEQIQQLQPQQVTQPATKEQTTTVQELVESPEVEPEVKEIIQQAPNYKITPKFNEWLRLYTDKSEKETWGNATRSAIKAYNLDPVRQYAVARLIGHENITKHNYLARDFMESEGYNLQYMMAWAIKKMQGSDTPGWWTAVMKHANFTDIKEGGITLNTQINNNTVNNVNAPEIADFNKKFLDFLESQEVTERH
jgi:hypothetical protein